jgi:hypothetical protein
LGQPSLAEFLRAVAVDASAAPTHTTGPAEGPEKRLWIAIDQSSPVASTFPKTAQDGKDRIRLHSIVAPLRTVSVGRR